MTCRGGTAARSAFFSLIPYTALLLVLSFLSAGCKRNISHTSDPRLKKIDEMLSAKLPPGTPQGLVQNFLKSRGYQLEAAPDRDSLRAVVRHIDTESLQPSTARVTFHFDSNSKLVSFELQPAPDLP